MRSKAIFLALLAFALGAQAETVSQTEAERAACAWARAGVSLGARLGTSVAETKTIDVAAGAAVYAVRLAEGGTVFLSSDTQVEPIVAFTSRSDVDLSAESPVAGLLRLDALARRRLAESSATTSSASSQTASAPASDSARKWGALLASEPSATTAASAVTAATSAKPLSGVNDVRVSPLLKSKWNQEEGGGGYCWNYYTPNHIACGCTATAAAQIMRYFTWPTAEMPQKTYSCELNGKAVSYTTKGGAFDWDNMPLVLSGVVSELKRQAIGHLAYDIGVTLQTSYDDVAGGGASPRRLGELYRIFGYAGGYMFWDGTSYSTGRGGLHDLELRKRVIYANLDAGRPVQLSIYGYPKGHLEDSAYWAGHSVVGDGYGFNVVGDVRTAYVHINMGWGGSDDMWYNIPEINAANSGAHVGDSGYDFLYMGGAAFNLSPSESGKDILSGRVTDDDGKGVAGAQVTASLDGAAVQTVATDANGIYAFALEGGKTYDVSAMSADGRQIDEVDAVFLRKTVGDSTRLVSASSNVGNSWGNDMTLVAPDVRIVIGDVTNIYSCLDKALVAAKAFSAAAPSQTVVIEVVGDTELKAAFTVDFPCEIRSAEGLFAVTRGKGAKLVVAEGGQVVVSDLAFAGATSTLFDVAAGGGVRVGAGVDFGVPQTVAAIRTADAAGFTITAAPKAWYAVACAAATDVDEVFGFADCAFDQARELAAKFVNLNDPNGEISGEAVADGTAPYALKWSLLPVPLEDATAYFVVDGQPETTNCFRRLDRLFERFADVDSPAEITVVRNGTLSRRVAPKAALTVVSPNGAVVSNLAASAGFDVTGGVRLVVDGLSFDGYKGDSLFLVDGGSLELRGGMAIRNVNGANGVYSGAVAVLRGAATLGDVEFEKCANANQSSYGGAVYLKDKACALTLRDGVSITGCSARKGGGGVYMGNGALAELSGLLTITGNTHGATSPVADDLYYTRSADAANTLKLAGLLAEGSRVGIRFGGTAGSALSKAGGEFIAVAADFTDASAVRKSAEAFFYDGNENLRATPRNAFAALAWVDETGSVTPVGLDVAAACVVGPAGERTGYETLEDAFAMLTGDGTIEVLADVELLRTVTVSNKVTLTSGDGGPYVVTRAAPCGFTVGPGGELTVAALTVDGRLDADHGGTGSLFVVNQGKLTLGDGAVVRDVVGDETRAGAIKVYRGSFTMLSGSAIRVCDNGHVDASSNNGRGGALTADTLSTVRLLGGVIEGCTANRGGAAFVGNESTLEIGGDFTATNNVAPDASANDVCVAFDSALLLVSRLEGRVGYVPGVNVDPYVFGKVAADFDGSDADVANSAHNFRHDITGDVGFAVRNGAETLLVWSDGLDAQGNYVANGKTYVPVGGGASVPTPVPDVVEGLVYNGAPQAGIRAGHGFVTDGVVSAVDADSYSAKLTLKAGFTWADGTTAATNLHWSIARATLTVTAVACGKVQGEPDPVLTYAVTGLQGADRADEVLTGELNRALGDEPGTYAINRGTLQLVSSNYDLVFVGADFTISEPPPPPPPPGPTVVTNTPDPIAFQSIERISALEWKLVVTNIKEKCEYCLTFTDDLKAGFVTTGAWERATFTGAWTTNVIFSSENPKSAFFWKALGRETYDKITPPEN